VGETIPDLTDALGTTREVLARVLDVMECPVCSGPLRGNGDAVSCERGHALPVTGGYLDASRDQAYDNATDRTFASFGYEWNTFSAVRSEDERFAEHYLRDLDLQRLEGAIGVDAGCGKGRYTRFLAEHLGALVALDGSDAVAAASKNLEEVANTVVIRSDLRRAPFADGHFGFVASLGVLHHLDDPRAGFDRLVRLLAPGGSLLLYLYSRPEQLGPRRLGLAAAAALRRVTVKLPFDVLRVLSVPIAALLYGTVVLGGRVGDQRHVEALAALPMATYRDKPFRSLVLDTFDRLSAPIEHRYVWSDLAPWFESSGLRVDAARDDSGWFIVAHRPAP
jgi:SAM-dependent methyltransferase